MKKQKYITPVCVVVEMEAEELLATSGEPTPPNPDEVGGDIEEKPGVGGSGDFDAVGSQGGGYNVWDD